MTKSRPLFFHFQLEMIYKLINQTISKDKYVFFFFFFFFFPWSKIFRIVTYISVIIAEFSVFFHKLYQQLFILSFSNSK